MIFGTMSTLFPRTMNACFRLFSPALLALVALAVTVQAQNAPPAGFERVDLSVDGVTRMALVHAPVSAKTNRTPVVFGFSGHGGTMAQAARESAMDREWPEAISVYPQALNTPGRLIDFEGKESGWQLRPGHMGDRDLKFFDALLARLKKDYQVDDKRVYALGMSSGGYFTFLLWAQRGEVLAAVAPVAAAAADNLPVLKPKPVLFVGGTNDQRVKYEWMRTTFDAARKLNGCAAAGTPWAEHCTLFPSTNGTPVVEFIHPGGHVYPKGANAAIVRFFKENSKR
jgi:polyhydroxybutyrate depolymerase